MKRCLLLLILLFAYFLPRSAAQSGQRQYFDGTDTSLPSALFIIRDTAAGNKWQVGKPQKQIFNAASTLPNAIVTDTLNTYAPNDTSRFGIRFRANQLGPVIAVRWKQKLDMRKDHSGGVVEFSKNGGQWQNVFNNTIQNVYNFYGYLHSNKDTLPGNIYAFSGRDTVWRDIWLCFRYLNPSDSFEVRYSLLTDFSTAVAEGWMIDNMMVQRTIAHTIGEAESSRDSKVYPTITTGLIFVEAAPRTTPHYIRSIRITDAGGRLVEHFADEQSRYMVDISRYPAGRYQVSVLTNLGSETFPVVLQH